MKHYLDEWQKSPLPVIPITDERVNLFTKYDVEMYLLAGSTLPFGTFKFLAALGLLDGLQEHGLLDKKYKYWEASSGRMAKVLAILAGLRGIPPEQFTFLMKPGVPSAKRGGLAFEGSWPTNPDAPNRDCIDIVREKGGGGWNGSTWNVGPDDIINPDQYAAPSIQRYYESWAVSSILDQIGEVDDLFCPLGTGGTLCGLAKGFHHRQNKEIAVIAAMCKDGQDIPGMRDEAGMARIKQPWQFARDFEAKVGREESYLCAPFVNRATVTFGGPSTGGTYVAACRWVQSIVDAGEEEKIHGHKMLIINHDEATPYVGDRFLSEFPSRAFYPPQAQLPRDVIFGKV